MCRILYESPSEFYIRIANPYDYEYNGLFIILV